MSDETPRFRVNGKEYPFPDRNSFTLGEARIIKRITGKTLSEVDELAEDDPDLLVAVIFIAMKRDDPKLTLEDVDAIEFRMIDFEEADESPPAEPPADTGGGDGESLSPETTPELSGVQT